MLEGPQKASLSAILRAARIWRWYVVLALVVAGSAQSWDGAATLDVHAAAVGDPAGSTTGDPAGGSVRGDAGNTSGFSTAMFGATDWPDGQSTDGGTAPVGFTRDGFSMQGYASAVEWYGDYVYVGASTVLQTYFAPAGATPSLVDEIEVRDWIREMAVGNDTLYVAARGDGLLAYDLGDDPASPNLVDRVSGTVDLPGIGPVEAVFNGVHAAGHRVAAARVNNVLRAQGGVDALVYDFDPVAGHLQLVHVVPASVRSKTATEVPITVGLTEDGGGLFVGYGVLVGELVYVSLNGSEVIVIPDDSTIAARGDIGAPFDIVTRGDVAFIAATGLCSKPDGCSMLSRVRLEKGVLVEEPLVTNAGSAAGGSVDVAGDLLCFATWSPGRYEGGNNLWLFDDPLAPNPSLRGKAGTPDWVFQIACRDAPAEPDFIYVADEWGGLEVWSADRSGLSLDMESQRVATGALSEGLWADGERMYSVKRGAGLWAFDAHDLGDERPVVEWIDLLDPGCQCDGCCPSAEGEFPYPPAVFVSAGASTHGRVAVLAADRNTAVAGDGYFMLFEEDGETGDATCVFSEPVRGWGGSLVETHGDDTVFATTAAHTLRVYQHCPGRGDGLHRVIDIISPDTRLAMSITDVVVAGDYVFVAEVRQLPLNVPDQGAVHVYRWQEVEANCPAVATNPEITYVGSFADDVIARTLEVDTRRNRLFVGTGAKPTFPVVQGGLYQYALDAFDSGDPAGFDERRVDITVPAVDRIRSANVHELLVDADDLYVVDRDNGLYRYSLTSDAYVGFFPAHRGPESQAFVAELVQSPDGVVPLYHPVAVAVLPDGRAAAHEHNSGRASILRPDAMHGPALRLPFATR